jgi:hypothetical protein
VSGADLAVLGGLGIGACWGWLLAPLVRASLLPLAWAAGSSALLAACAALASAAAVAPLAGVAVGFGAHHAWRFRVRGGVR